MFSTISIISIIAIMAYVAFSIVFWLITPKCNNNFIEFAVKSEILLVVLLFIWAFHWFYLYASDKFDSYKIRHAEIISIPSMEFKVSELKNKNFSVDLVPKLEE